MAFSTDQIHDLPYRFPEGLRVFIIHHDATQLNDIADMCFQCHYEVTTCTVASFAVHLLRETKGSFDVILLEAQMPEADMDSYDFLQRVTQEIKTPIIMMGDDNTTSARMNAIEKGACEYWVKPLNVNHINNMWQHVATIQEQDQILRILEVKTGQKLMKRDEESVTKETNSCDNAHYHQLPTKKNRLSWSPELHEQFLRAVNQIGIDKATPKAISKLMDVPGLTRMHISSHLQKLRTSMKRPSKKTKLKKKLSNSKQDQNNESVEVKIESMLPEHNESLQVVESMVPAEQNDQNVAVLNSECANNFDAQAAQQHLNMFDDFEFEVSNMFTDKTNMMLDGSYSSLLNDEMWHHPYEQSGWC